MDDRMVSLALEIHRLAFQDKSRSPNGMGFVLRGHQRNPLAPRSPFLFNFRTPDNPKPGRMQPHNVERLSEGLFERAKQLGLSYDHIAGIPNAGDPYALDFANACARYGLHPSLLKLGKHEAKGKRVITGIREGSYTPGKPAQVLLIDDLVTEADSKYDAIEVLNRLYGFTVLDILVFVDREQGGVQQLAQDGVRVHALFTVTELLDLYLERKLITPTIYDEIRAYLRRPA